MITKIEKLHQMRKKNNFNFKIAVDGNVNPQTVPHFVAAGADMLIGGSSGIFMEGISLQESFETLRASIKEGLRLRESI